MHGAYVPGENINFMVDILVEQKAAVKAELEQERIRPMMRFVMRKK